jgi:hypothetical protein
VWLRGFWLLTAYSVFFWSGAGFIAWKTDAAEAWMAP